MTKLRAIPKMDKLLSCEELKKFNTAALKPLITHFLEKYRHNLLDGGEVLEFQDCVEEIKNLYLQQSQKSLTPVINATGIVVHTNLGRSVFSHEILEEIMPLLSSYNNLEYDLKEGNRTERYYHLRNLFRLLVPCEDILIVNNNAAAVFLILNTFAKGKEVIVSRGELIEIGGSFRIPRVMEDSGAILREIGTTNKTYLQDYKEALNENTAMIFKAHKSNYEIKGFSYEVDYKELIDFAREKEILDYYDLGSGYLGFKKENLDKTEISLEEIATLNPSLVSFSGDKLLGSTQAGIIFGKKKYINALKKNQLLRMLRVDKFTLSCLEATLKAYLDKAYHKIPTFAFIAQTKEELYQKAQELLTLIPTCFAPQILPSQSYSGGGAMPNKALPSYAIALNSPKAQKLENALREHKIIARIEQEKILLDVRTLYKQDFAKIQTALLAIAKE